MHSVAQRVFSIHEITLEILQIAANSADCTDWCDNTEVAPSSVLLRAAALSCKTIMEPALDLLWEDIPGEEHLAKILSMSMVKLVGEPLATDLRNVAPSLLVEELWCRFRSYSSRVRRMHVTNHAESSQLFAFALMAAPRRASFFPKLRTVTCEFGSIGTDGLMFFLAPTVRNILMKKGEDEVADKLRDHQVHPWLTALPPLVPNLERLTVGAETMPLNSLGRMTSLTHLQVMLRHDNKLASLEINQLIALLPNLAHISVTGGMATIIADSVDGGSLVHAKLLKISSRSWSNYNPVDLVEHFPATDLDELHIDVWDMKTTDDRFVRDLLWRALTRVLRAKYAKSLKVLNFAVGDYSGPWGADSALGRSFIEPLLHLHEIRRLSVSLRLNQNPFGLADADLEAMVAAWPYLTDLTLSGSHIGANQPLISLQGLVHLAHHAPRLKTVKLPINATGFSLHGEDILVPLSRHGLQSLQPVHHDGPWDATVIPAEVALFIHRLFPLARVEKPLSFRMVSVEPDRWDEVRCVFETMRD